MAAVDLGCWWRQGGDGKLKIAHSAEPGNQRAELLQAVMNQPAASPLAEWNARIMQSNCAREEGMERRGEAALHTVSSGACHSMCQQLGGLFPGKKGGYPGPGPWQLCVSDREPSVQLMHCLSVFVPCPAQQSLPWAKDLWEFWEGRITRLCHRPRSTPGHCQSGAGHSHERLVSLCMPTSYWVLHPACPTTSQVPLQEESKWAGCSAPRWLEASGKQDVSRRLRGCDIARASPWKNRDNNNRADAEGDFLHLFPSGFPGALCSNTRPGFGTETRESADMTEIRWPFQQQQNLSHQPACAAPLQSYIPVSCQRSRCFNMQDTFPEGCDTWP